MDYKGKKFTDLTNGRIVEVKDYFEDVAILDNNSRIKVARLLDKNYFDEYIDPQSFFKNDNLLSTFAQKIRQIPDDVIQNMNESSSIPVDINNINGSTSIRPSFDEPAVLQSDPELEKEELMKKYGIVDTNVNVIQNSTINAAQKQLETFKNLLEDVEVIENDVQKININRDDIGEVINNSNFISEKDNRESKDKVDDPIISMFRNVKRNTDLNIQLTIENKIPRSDFIEMMEDSYNTSIIDFLAQEFTDNLLKNPDIIKQKIKDEINNIVYNSDKMNVKPLESVSEQVNASKNKPSRKPRPNTTQGQKRKLLNND